jgi:hypothetical protein
MLKSRLSWLFPARLLTKKIALTKRLVLNEIYVIKSYRYRYFVGILMHKIFQNMVLPAFAYIQSRHGYLARSATLYNLVIPAPKNNTLKRILLYGRAANMELYTATYKMCRIFVCVYNNIFTEHARVCWVAFYIYVFYNVCIYFNVNIIQGTNEKQIC